MKISHGNMCMGQSPREFQAGNFQLSCPSRLGPALTSPRNNAHGKTRGAFPTSQLPGPQCPEVLSGRGHREMVDSFPHLQRLSLTPCGPKPPPQIHCQHRQSGVAEAPGQTKILLYCRTFQGLRDYPSGVESKGQNSLWERLILYYNMSYMTLRGTP